MRTLAVDHAISPVVVHLMLPPALKVKAVATNTLSPTVALSPSITVVGFQYWYWGIKLSAFLIPC